MRHTKIIATLGPASDAAETLEAVMRAGVDVVRLNFSHGTQEGHGRVLQRVRATAGTLRRAIAVLQDLGGPKIRTGLLEGGAPLTLVAGEPLVIGVGSFVGRAGLVSTTYAPLAKSLRPGDRLLLDDGRIEVAVESVASDTITTRVVDGGVLGEHKGINAPNVPLPQVGLTPKDEADLMFGLAAGVDLVALSFVQSAADVTRARSIAAEAGRVGVPIIAKLERPQAIQRLPEIVDAADAVMVARGDLGLEMPLEQVPQVQKEVLRLARDRGVPVIVATQVLESMRTEPRPTRAEVGDAAGAVDAGADAILLSGETAVGSYPVQTVQFLDSIIRNAEAVPPPWALPAPADVRRDHLPALCDAAVTLAARGHADAIIAVTRAGRTARLLSARRPTAPIVAVTDKEDVARRLCLWWGVLPVIDNLQGEAESLVAHVVEELRRRNVLAMPSTVVVVSANPDLAQRAANFLRIRRL